MKQILIYSIILFFAFPSLAQKQEVDSLLKLIKNENIDRSEAYNLLYKKLKRADLKAAKSYLDKGYYEALKYENKKTLGASLNYLGYYYKKQSEIDTALILLNRALSIRLEINDSIGVSKVYNNLGGLFLDKSLYRKAVENLEKALELKLKLNQIKGAGISYNAIGNAYNKWGKNKKAIEYFQKALEMFTKAEMPNGVSSCYNNIGLIYQNLAKETDTVFMNKSLTYYLKALEINKKNEYLFELADNQSNIANIYAAKAEQYRLLSKTENKTNSNDNYSQISNNYFNIAVNYVEQSLQHRKKIGDQRGLAGSYIGLGAIYINKNTSQDAKKALPQFEKALDISLEIDDKYLSTVCYSYLGMVYIQLGKYSQSLNNLEKSKKLADENNLRSQMTNIYESLSEVYDSLGNYKKAYKAYIKFHAYSDSTSTEDTKKIITESAAKFETAQKEAALEIANKENEAQQLKSKQQMLIIYGFTGVFVIIIIFSVVVYRQFKQIRESNYILSEQKAQIEKANEELYQSNEEISAQRDEIQYQKDHIEEIHQEVSDSIHYAERIQRAILPTVEDINEKISDRFTLFKPKDIVSGDFHWSKHIKKNNLFVATAADCTGHGVPGAFMSMLGIAFLNEIVSKSSVKETGQVLDNLRQSVMTSLHQTGAEGEAQDGMDIALVALNYETKVIQFSGANNPLYIIRPKDKQVIEIADKVVEGETHTLYEIKGDKMPIGIYKKELTDFITVTIQLEEGDQIYMFSDGYADQFGGPKGKKLKYKPFKGLLLRNANKSMAEQSKILDDYFEDWRGMLEQIDDVIVMGIKI